MEGLLAAHGRMDQPCAGLSATGPCPGWACRDVPFARGACVGPAAWVTRELHSAALIGTGNRLSRSLYPDMFVKMSPPAR